MRGTTCEYSPGRDEMFPSGVTAINAATDCIGLVLSAISVGSMRTGNRKRKSVCGGGADVNVNLADAAWVGR